MEREKRSNAERQVILANIHGDGVHFDKRMLGKTRPNKNKSSKLDKTLAQKAFIACGKK
jgi:hypothetical protein